MGRYKFNNRGTGTIFWLFSFFIQWRIQGGGWQGWSPPPPHELVPILKTYCKVFVTGTDHRPPLGMWMTSHRQCPMGGGCLWMSKSGGVFQFFGRRMTSRGQCPRGGACECPRVGFFFNFPEGGWRHADNVQGGGVLVECLHPPPPPSGNPVSAPVICVKFRANQPLSPP